MEVHLVGRHIVLEKPYATPHGDFQFQTAANLHGRFSEKFVFVHVNNTPF
jgi:hypothetical protein